MTCPVNLEDFVSRFDYLTFMIQSHERKRIIIEELLPEHDIKLYRALVARANYLAQDRSDIQFSVKELARSMSSPTRGS